MIWIAAFRGTLPCIQNEVKQSFFIKDRIKNSNNSFAVIHNRKSNVFTEFCTSTYTQIFVSNIILYSTNTIFKYVYIILLLKLSTFCNYSEMSRIIMTKYYLYVTEKNYKHDRILLRNVSVV